METLNDRVIDLTTRRRPMSERQSRDQALREAGIPNLLPSLKPTAAPTETPSDSAILACMVILLNDAESCLTLYGLANSGGFGDVIRDVAKMMAGRGMR